MAILKVLAERPGQVVSRETFLDLVWGYNAYPTTRAVDTHVASLRAKLNAEAAIETVHGAGYRLASGHTGV